MHVYFSGIGGAGIGPLALIAHQAGYKVSGSDKQDSSYIEYLINHGVSDIHIGQDWDQISAVNQRQPIDWVVYSSAVPKENPNHPELEFARENGIQNSKRDDFLNELLTQTNQKMIAIAGTHGKTTTTAMIIWLMKELKIPVSFSVGAKLSFADYGKFNAEANYFIYEADEYDRNFLSFSPAMSVIAGVAYDHPDIYPTEEEYQEAFKQFINQSEKVILWQKDATKLQFSENNSLTILSDTTDLSVFKLPGLVNRQDAHAVVVAAEKMGFCDYSSGFKIMNSFPGVSRRFEQIAKNIYSDYAHTPEKIRGALQLAFEIMESKNLGRIYGDGMQESDEKRSKTYQAYDARVSQSLPQQTAADNAAGVVVVYEGLHNTRQHFIKNELEHLFAGVKKLFIVPSYLAREDESLELLTPEKLCDITREPHNRQPAQLDDDLKHTLKEHAKQGDLVLCLTAGGGGSLDEWLRREF